MMMSPTQTGIPKSLPAQIPHTKLMSSKLDQMTFHQLKISSNRELSSHLKIRGNRMKKIHCVHLLDNIVSRA